MRDRTEYTYEIRARGATAFVEGLPTLDAARRAHALAVRVCPRSIGESGWRILRVAPDGTREWVEED